MPRRKIERPVPRILLDPVESAAALGMSLSHFQRHVQPHLPRRVYSGSLTLYPLSDLERWAEDEATTAGGRAA